MMIRTILISTVILILMYAVFTVPAHAIDTNEFLLFNIEERRNELQHPDFANIKQACLAPDIKLNNKNLKPIEALHATDSYGTDNSINDFSWYLMIQGSRALAGNKQSEIDAQNRLVEWATAKALTRTKEHYDPYYAIKRALLPLITTYAIVRDTMSESNRTIVEKWLDGLVRRIDATFDGDVDHNNHRYLADSVLMLWGSYINDNTLYQKGINRFETALNDMQTDGSLPLENRRGARALWYLRQSLADLTVIAEVARNKGDNLYGMDINGKSIGLLMNHYLSGLSNPATILEQASQNYIPGPSDNFLQQDMGMLQNRGRRHLMAFAESYRLNATNEFSKQRLNNLMKAGIDAERPLIDDYIGGNATCFWAKP